MALVPFHGPAERIFDRALDGEQDAWTTMEHVPEVLTRTFNFSVHTSDRNGQRFVRMTFEADFPLDTAILSTRPELIFHPRRPEFDGLILECGVDIQAPGNGVAWAKMRPAPDSSRVSTLISALVGRFCDVQQLKGGEDKEPEFIRMRIMTRRDFPRPGCFTSALIPLHPETLELYDELGSRTAIVVVLEPHEDPDKCRIRTLKKQPTMPEWAMPIAGLRVAKMLHSMFEEEIRMHLRCLHSPAWLEARDDSRYIIISLRKCANGGPLWPCSLPVLPEGMWEQTDTYGQTKISLAAYLKEFLQRLGIEDAPLFQSLDGVALVPYQVAVKQAIWDELWSFLKDPWRAQRAAYRWLFGGSAAPELKVVSKPQLVFGKHPDLEVAARQGRPSASEDMPVRSTFVHIPKPRTQKRCGSLPPRSAEESPVLAC